MSSNPDFFSLWSLVQEERDRKKKDAVYEELRYIPDKPPVDREEGVPPRMYRTVENTNPLNLQGVIGDVDSLLRDGTIEEKRLLSEEIDLVLAKDGDYFVKILNEYKGLKDPMGFTQFIEGKIRLLLESGKKRRLETYKSLQEYSKHYSDKHDLQNIPQDYREYYYSQYQKILYAEKVMAVFQGIEEIFQDPFGLGLEPSLKPYIPGHFDHTVFNERDGVQIKEERRNSQNDVQDGSRFMDFVKNM